MAKTKREYHVYLWVFRAYDVHDKGIVVKCKSVKELRKINSLAVAFYSTATDIPLWNIGRARIRAKDVSKDADIWSADFIEQARILQRANCLGGGHFIKANNNYVVFFRSKPNMSAAHEGLHWFCKSEQITTQVITFKEAYQLCLSKQAITLVDGDYMMYIFKNK